MPRDGRKHKRLALEFEINWTIEEQRLSGKGKLVDVSLLGASFLIDTVFTVERSVVFRLCASEVPAFPSSARLRWFRRITAFPPEILVGVIFEGAVSPGWSEWVYQNSTPDDQKDKE